MKGIIWYNYQKSGIIRLKNLIYEYEQMNISIVKKNLSTNPFVVFSNGDIWKVVKANDNARGSCCNISLIEDGVEQQLIERIIMPATKSKPYRAIGYYSSINKEA